MPRSIVHIKGKLPRIIPPVTIGTRDLTRKEINFIMKVFLRHAKKTGTKMTISTVKNGNKRRVK